MKASRVTLLRIVVSVVQFFYIIVIILYHLYKITMGGYRLC